MSDRFSRRGRSEFAGAGPNEFERGTTCTIDQIDADFWEIVATLQPVADDHPIMAVELTPNMSETYDLIASVRADAGGQIAMLLAALGRAPLENVLPKIESSYRMLHVCQNWANGRLLMLGETETDEKQARAIWRDRSGVVHLLHERIMTLLKRQLVGTFAEEEQNVKILVSVALTSPYGPRRIETSWAKLEVDCRLVVKHDRIQTPLLVVFVEKGWCRCQTLTRDLSWAKPEIYCFALAKEENYDLFVQDWLVFVDRCEAAVKHGGAQTPEGQELQTIFPSLDFEAGILPGFNQSVFHYCPSICVVDGDMCTATPLTR